jgi:hypothetical protein
MRVNLSPVIPLFIAVVEDGETCEVDFGWICDRSGEGIISVMIFYFTNFGIDKELDKGLWGYQKI